MLQSEKRRAELGEGKEDLMMGSSFARKSAQLLLHHTTVSPEFFFPLDFGSFSLAGLWHDKDAQIPSRLAG